MPGQNDQCCPVHTPPDSNCATKRSGSGDYPAGPLWTQVILHNHAAQDRQPLSSQDPDCLGNRVNQSVFHCPALHDFETRSVFCALLKNLQCIHWPQSSFLQLIYVHRYVQSAQYVQFFYSHQKQFVFPAYQNQSHHVYHALFEIF